MCLKLHGNLSQKTCHRRNDSIFAKMEWPMLYLTDRIGRSLNFGVTLSYDRGLVASVTDWLGL